MRIISAIPGILRSRVPGADPWLNGPQEVRFPARGVEVPYGQPLRLKDADAVVVLKRYGPAGIEEIPEEARDGEIADYLVRAKRRRYAHLSRVINQYRMEQATRQAAGVGVAMPTEHHRKILAELRGLKAEILADDPVLQEELLVLKDQIVPDDPLAEELEQFGIPKEAAPLVPGVKAGGAIEL